MVGKELRLVGVSFFRERDSSSLAISAPSVVDIIPQVFDKLLSDNSSESERLEFSRLALSHFGLDGEPSS